MSLTLRKRRQYHLPVFPFEECKLTIRRWHYEPTYLEILVTTKNHKRKTRRYPKSVRKKTGILNGHIFVRAFTQPMKKKNAISEYQRLSTCTREKSRDFRIYVLSLKTELSSIWEYHIKIASSLARSTSTAITQIMHKKTSKTFFFLNEEFSNELVVIRFKIEPRVFCPFSSKFHPI